MGFFDRFYYGKAGKRDYSEMDMPKTRVSLFFLVLKDHIFDLIKVNAMQLIFWLPFMIWSLMNLLVIQNIDASTLMQTAEGTKELMGTISGYFVIWLIGLSPCIAITGPSSAGSAYVMRNWARDEHAFIFSDFKDAFKSNWKQSLAVSVMTAVLPVILYTAVMYYSQMTSTNMIMIVPMVFVISVGLINYLLAFVPFCIEILIYCLIASAVVAGMKKETYIILVIVHIFNHSVPVIGNCVHIRCVNKGKRHILIPKNLSEIHSRSFFSRLKHKLL